MMSRSVPRILAAAALSLGAPTATRAEVLPEPEYEVTVGEAAALRTLFQKNDWAQELQASNLYRGGLVRLGPILFAAGTEGKDPWTGRLVDSLLDRILARHPVRLSYTNTRDLVSPFGVTLGRLSPDEQAALRLVIEGLRSGPSVPTEVGSGSQAVTLSVAPLLVRRQKLAVAENGTCVAISRDPRLAAALAQRCDFTIEPGKMVVEVRTTEFFAPWSVVLEKLVGLGERVRATFQFDETRARYSPSSGFVELRAGHLVGRGPVSAQLLGMIPADALFVTTVFLPDPGALSAGSVETLFRTARSSRPTRYAPVTLAFLGMEQAEGSDKLVAATVLLVPQPALAPGQRRAIEALFSQSRRYEVHVSDRCPGFVALSPSVTALERCIQACEGQRPSFRQLPPAVSDALTREPVSAFVTVNGGALLRSALLDGWRAAAGSQDTPPEIAEAAALLDRLPFQAFVGAAGDDGIILTGVEP